MSNQNKLQIFDISEFPEFNLTELENCMIALNIIFQKVFRLPKSRWPAMKDRTVNIPIYEADVIKTVESLPRTPNEAGIIPINLKRKVSYKNCHMTQYVSVSKLVKALESLKKLGNKYYQFVPETENFKEKCLSTDIEGFCLIFPQDELLGENNINSNIIETEHRNKNKIQDEICGNYEELIEKTVNQDSVSECVEAAKDLGDLVDAEEEEYLKKDSVKKWQFHYNQSTCFSNNYPEINYLEDNSGNISIAPGEGKLPSNLLEENDWDLKTFPCLLPDGQNSLHAKREMKLSEQDYFVQRVMNKNTRFAHNPAFIFAAIALIERSQV